ncbi:sphingosine kinase 2-like isoform X2 [Dinothrombium tinctorium]|uniref:sphingosine kinase n=1 Tax=Dinothrombium tinctorium TaxID=1965070 RepID=A0A443RS67_9ACAR|nr:sphingosine kinase 2-like isoform X2 [Dinothrombium tinctorium]
MKVWNKSIALLLNNEETIECKARRSDMLLLSDTLQFRSSVNSRSLQQCAVKLTDNCLCYRLLRDDAENKVEECLQTVLLSDVIGCQIHSNDLLDSETAVLLHIYAYPLRLRTTLNLVNRQAKRVKKTLILIFDKSDLFDDNYELAAKWMRAILWLIRRRDQLFLSDCTVNIPEMVPQQRKLLVLINPASGPGKALEIFEQRVVPIFLESDIRYKVVITEYSKSGLTFVKNTIDLLTQWDSIVVVSGDGLLFEVFNGLMQRPDWEKAIKMPVGIIPGGSGNGIAHSINYASGEPSSTNPIISAALNVVRGKSIPTDLVRIKTSKRTIYSCLSIGWGLIADIDIESERLRAVGGARFTIWALIRAMALRKYKGRLSYLPVPGVKRPKAPVTQNFISSRIPKSNTFDYRPDLLRKPVVQRSCSLDSPSIVPLSDVTVEYCNEVEISKTSSEMEKKNDSTNNSSSNPKTSSESSYSSEWVTVDGDFVLVYSSYPTHISSDCFFTPGAKFDDGIIWLVYILGSAKRSQIIQFLASLSSGNHINLPFVCSVPVRSFKLEPKSNQGRITVDGELIECCTLEADVMPSVARLLAR